jgi:hypothetical protein
VDRINDASEAYKVADTALTVIMLIYEGNNGDETLDWSTRVRVVLEAAQGMI